MLKFSYRFVLKKGYINDSLKIIFSSKLIISPRKDVNRYPWCATR